MPPAGNRACLKTATSFISDFAFGAVADQFIFHIPYSKIGDKKSERTMNAALENSPAQTTGAVSNVADMSVKLAFSKKLQAVTNRIHATSNIDEIMLDVTRDICQLFDRLRISINVARTHVHFLKECNGAKMSQFIKTITAPRIGWASLLYHRA